MNTYLAVDFGSASGRIMAGVIFGGQLHLEEIYKFPNRPIKLDGHYYWDFFTLFQEMKNGFAIAVRKGYEVKSIGIDTWGVDFGLIDKEGNLLGNPACYPDSRTMGIPEEVFRMEGRSAHSAQTGMPTMSSNTLFQLYSLKLANKAQLKMADKLLFMSDLFSFFLTGVANSESCIASTSDSLDARKSSWSKNLINNLDLPLHLLGPIVEPGTLYGKLKKEIADETGLGNVDVVAVGSHDTASSICAIPSVISDKAYLSLGVQSLLGAEVDRPILTEEASTCGFSNKGGVGGKICFLQHITGLSILQRLMTEWNERGKGIAYDQVLSQAGVANIHSKIDVDDIYFQNPVDMERAIIVYCYEHNLQEPHTQGEFVRCVLESLAFRYKKGIDQLNRFLSTSVRQIHIIGEGCCNKLLNQLIANATGIPVYAAPVEAAIIGNIMVQAKAAKEVDSWDQLKEIIMNSTNPQVYYPEQFNRL